MILPTGKLNLPLPALQLLGTSSKPRGSSKAVPLMNSDFTELLTILNDCQVEYLVVGGYAFIHYAEPRYTKDIDLWIRPSTENAVRLRESLIRFGGWVEGMTLDHFSMERTMFQIGLPPCRVDFLTSIPGLDFTAAYQARVVSDVGGVSVPFLSLHHLIEAKRCAGRQQDLLDVAALEQVKGGNQ